MTAGVEYAEVARLHGRRTIRVQREPVEPLAAGEVRLRVTAVGLCGSDLHWYAEGSIGDAELSRPLVLGHEFAGVIADGPRAGERVVADPADPCGQCGPCLDGRSNLCLAIRFAGHGTTDGALRSIMPWPERLLYRLPEAIAADEAALLEPLGVALHAADLAHVPPGGRAGVYGCGPLGLLLVQVLRIAGASSVVATDRLAHRVEMARMLGAGPAYDVDEPSSAAGRRSARATEVDVAFEVAGTDEALDDAITAVRPGGRVVLVGIPTGDRTSFAAGVARRKGLSLLLCRRMVPTNLSRAIELAASGRIQVAPLVTARFPLARAPEAFATLAARTGVKVIVEPAEPTGPDDR